MTMQRRWPVIAVLVLAFLSFVVWRACVVLLRPALQIGPETTFITGPLRADGQPDYETALHERLSAGVSPDDNAVVLLIEALGCADVPPEHRDRYFQCLGVAPVPDQGQESRSQGMLIYKTSEKSASSAETTEALSKQFSEAGHRPWRSDEFPVVREWLELNAGALDLIERASHKTALYWPVVERSTTSLMGMSHMREAGRLLVTRAMYRLGEGDRRAARNDLLACHRLAMLYSQRAALTNDFQVATVLNRMASGGDAWIISTAATADDARECLAEFQNISPLAPLATVIDQSTRLQTLDSCLAQFPQIGLDVNVVMRKTNRLCDDIVVELKKSDRFVARQGIQAIDRQLKRKAVLATTPMNQALAYLLHSRRAISAGVSDTLLSLWVDAQRRAHDSELGGLVKRDLVEMGFRLAAYRAEHGEYPEQLEQLVPDFLPVVPTDPFVGRPLKYIRTNEGFVVYSVGANEVDDGGDQTRPKDDIALQIPVKLEN